MVPRVGLGDELPTFYSPLPKARDLPDMRWVSSLAGAFASSTATFLKTASRKGLKEPHLLSLTIQNVTFGGATEENGSESLSC